MGCVRERIQSWLSFEQASEQATNQPTKLRGGRGLGQISDRTAQIKREINKIIITTHKHVQLIQIKFHK